MAIIAIATMHTKITSVEQMRLDGEPQHFCFIELPAIDPAAPGVSSSAIVMVCWWLLWWLLSWFMLLSAPRVHGWVLVSLLARASNKTPLSYLAFLRCIMLSKSTTLPKYILLGTQHKNSRTQKKIMRRDIIRCNVMLLVCRLCDSICFRSPQ